MKKILLLLLYIYSFAFGDNSYLPKSTIVESKTIDGTKYYIVHANADIARSNSANSKKQDKFSLVYANLEGKVAVSNKEYKTIPNAHNGKIDIYYLINENEKGKQSHNVVFKRENITFPPYSLIKDNQRYGKDIPYEGKSKVSYNTAYGTLFVLFMILSGFLYSFKDLVNSIPIKVRLFIQAVIIVLFFIGIEKVINVESAECSQSVIETTGTVEYFLDKKYVIFKNCNGDNSRSQMNIKELNNRAEYSPVKIYYSQKSQGGSVDNRGHVFSYKVYFSKSDALEKTDMPLRTKVAYFMLLIWLYHFSNSMKKLTLPSFIKSENRYFVVNPNSKEYSEIVSKIRLEEFRKQSYSQEYKIYTDEKGKINIKRTSILTLIIAILMTLGLLWILSRLFSNISNAETTAFYGFVAVALFLVSIFIFISIKSFSAVKHIGIFDYKTKKYQSFTHDETISFDKIYALIILNKRVRVTTGSDSDFTVYENIFILDLLLDDGKIINLVANKDKSILLDEAKIISSYIKKPILDLGKPDYNKIKEIHLNNLL